VIFFICPPAVFNFLRPLENVGPGEALFPDLFVGRATLTLFETLGATMTVAFVERRIEGVCHAEF